MSKIATLSLAMTVGELADPSLRGAQQSAIEKAGDLRVEDCRDCHAIARNDGLESAGIRVGV